MWTQVSALKVEVNGFRTSQAIDHEYASGIILEGTVLKTRKLYLIINFLPPEFYSALSFKIQKSTCFPGRLLE